MSYKALIVDDNEQNLDLLEAVLNGCGYIVTKAHNGVEALKKAKKEIPDIIISDILMPVMDGFVLCREWVKDSRLKNVPFIFYTATYTDSRDEELALSLGAVRFLIKPVSPKDFIIVINQLLAEAKAGHLRINRQPEKKETEYYRLYNETLVRKLKDKMVKIEELNLSLKKEIEEHKHAEQKIQELNRDLEIKVKQGIEEIRNKDHILINQFRLASMGEMISSIAHQWRQPLNIIGLQTQNLRMKLEYELLTIEEARKYEINIMDQLNTMSHTIDDFRNYFKPDCSETEFLVDEVLNNALILMESCFQSQAIVLVKIIEGNIRAKGFPHEYGQVLLNILINAKDILVERQIKNPEIIITLEKAGGNSVLRIRDNGGGINKEIMDRLFEPYFTTKEMGTGIGLFMSKMIIEKSMHGDLTVRNTDDGVEFSIIIKLSNQT